MLLASLEQRNNEGIGGRMNKVKSNKKGKEREAVGRAYMSFGL